jgi:hypothetical protein
MSATAHAIRPRRVGEVLDAAIKIYLRNARTLIGLTAVVVIPMRVLAGIVLLSTLPNGSAVPGGTFNLNSGSQPAADRSAVLGANVTLIVIELIVNVLVIAACTKAVSDAYLDQPVGAAASLRFAVRRAPALFVLYILIYLGLIVAFLLFIIPGIWLYAAWSVAVPALLIERLGPFRAPGRSRRLVKGRWWATAAVLIVATLMVTLINGAIEAVLIAIASLPSRPSLLLAVLASTLSGVIATTITAPFLAAAVTLLYYDLRVRREGYDLHVLADQLGIPSASMPAGTDGGYPDWVAAPGDGSPSGAHPIGPESIGQPGGPPFWPPPPGWTPGQ